MLCNRCQGSRWKRVPSGLEVYETPALSGLMLVCQDCDRPVCLLHRAKHEMTKAHRNRVARAERRLAMRGIV